MAETERTKEYLEVIGRRVTRATSLDDAWLALYSLLLWLTDGIPHIIDANLLKRPGKWRTLAAAVGQELARALSIPEGQLAQHVGALYSQPGFWRDNNMTGKAFVLALSSLLARFVPPFRYIPEARIGVDAFQGVTHAPRKSPDLTVMRGDDEVAVISAKWSIRHDRLRDPVDECNYFKTLRQGLKFYVVTNEFYLARLAKLGSQFCIDHVVHVNKSLLEFAFPGDQRINGVSDLTDLPRIFSQL